MLLKYFSILFIVILCDVMGQMLVSFQTKLLKFSQCEDIVIESSNFSCVFKINQKSETSKNKLQAGEIAQRTRVRILYARVPRSLPVLHDLLSIPREWPLGTTSVTK